MIQRHRIEHIDGRVIEESKAQTKDKTGAEIATGQRNISEIRVGLEPTGKLSCSL